MERPFVGAILVSILAFATLSRAQNFRGSLAGTVEDPSGARIPFAKITIHAAESSFERDATGNKEGAFLVDDLLPGVYVVTVTATGFSKASSDVTIQVSSVRAIKVRLEAAGVAQSVSVQGQASSITTQPMEITNTVNQGVVTAQDLATIPLASRTFANIAYMVPGTEPVEPSDPTKARITAVSFGGSSGLNDKLTVDGADNSDDYIGGFLQNFSPDAIQEFAVSTSAEDTNTGGTTGGSIVITTKRGTNDFHGEAGIYARASALNARFPIDNPAPDPKQPFSRQNYEGTLGGPIQTGKLWFFSSFEYVHENASIAYSPSSIPEFNALSSLASQGFLPGVSSIDVPQATPVPFRDVLGSVRLDWSQSSRSQWFLRGSVDQYTTKNDLIQQATLPSTGASSYSKYLNLALSNQFTFSPTWEGSFVFGASGLHHTESRNSDLGYALAFPFSATFSTISGFETFGDNQFATPITAFPVLRNQEKYQFRYVVSHVSGSHAPRFGIDFIHEPVLSGALSGTAETLVSYPNDPSFYAADPSQFYFSSECATAPSASSGITCDFTPAGDGSFSQNVQRLGIFAEDSWRATPRLTVNYGLRYDTTFGLLTASQRSQLENPAYLTLNALHIPLINGKAQDYHAAFAPRLGVAYALGPTSDTVIRAGIGLYYNDLAQNGWVSAFQAVNAPPGPCTNVGDPSCIPGSASGGAGAIIDPNYKTPYALHATAGVDHAFNANWALSAEWTHEQGVHAYRAYNYVAGFTLFSPLIPASDPNYQADQQAIVPDVTVYRTDNRSRYDGLLVHLQGNVSRRLNLTVNYTLSSADTWGCVVGELFDYVNGVCNPLNAFGPGDYGPSGEDVRHRFVFAAIVHAPFGIDLSTLSQFESARPFTIGTPVDVNGTGDPTNDRAVVNGVQTTLDEFRGTPYQQIDLRVSRPFTFHERWTIIPFIEFFNLLNRNNPGNNFVADISALPTPVNDLSNATAFCLDASCTQTQAITNLKQLRVPAGALGDFFGPGTTVGIPFAAQLGARVSF
jgi:Carboxypeptidase regulatory-like domain/TonB dependent receptor